MRAAGQAPKSHPEPMIADGRSSRHWPDVSLNRTFQDYSLPVIARAIATGRSHARFTSDDGAAFRRNHVRWRTIPLHLQQERRTKEQSRKKCTRPHKNNQKCKPSTFNLKNVPSWRLILFDLPSDRRINLLARISSGSELVFVVRLITVLRLVPLRPSMIFMHIRAFRPYSHL